MHLQADPQACRLGRGLNAVTGEFDAEQTEIVAEALFWFSFSLPFAGANLLLTRTFFALQRPWVTTALSGGQAQQQGAFGER